MKVSWKKNKKLNPSIILKKIDEIKIVSKGGRLSFEGFEFHEAIGHIQNMVNFPAHANGLEHGKIVQQAVSNIAREAQLNSDKVIDEINRLIINELKTHEQKFHLLTTISIIEPLPQKLISINGARIRLLPGSYPKKYDERSRIINSSALINAHEATPENYTKLIITIEAKSANAAGTEALRIIDLQRAIWSLFSNSAMELFSQRWRPINKIRLGGAHTIHKENGMLADSRFWYEPIFTTGSPFRHNKVEILKKNSQWVADQLASLSYSSIIEDVFVRYVRAMDERDPNVALIRLWGAIETLAASDEKNCDQISKRASFLLTESDYHKQIIENIREYRNRSVHSGDQSDTAKSYCYQLQGYLYHLILFHLKSCGQFNSISEANNFLDLPDSKEELGKRKELLERALKFRNPPH